MSNEVTPVSIPNAGVVSLFDLDKSTPPVLKEQYEQASVVAQTRTLRSGREGETVVIPEKKVADGLLEFFSSTGPLQTTLGNIQESVQKFGNTINGVQTGSIDANTYKTLKYQYANLYVKTALGEAANNIDRAGDNINATVDKASKKLVETFKPVSSFVGSSLYLLTGLMKDPIGTVTDLPDTVGSILDNINPGIRAKNASTTQKNNISKLAEMPGQLFGNIQQMVKAVDGIISVPIGLVSDLYRGFFELIGKINDFVNKIFTGLSKAIDSILDGLFPGLNDFLAQATVFTSQIGQISTVFSGVNQIAQFTNQLTVGVSQLNSFIQNPLDIASAYLPPQISQGIYALRNPQALINQFLPPQLSQAFAGISNITGFGFNGNMGFGLQSVLQGMQGGVLASILQGFSTQFSILSPSFTGQATTPQYFANQTGTTTTPTGATYTTPRDSNVIIGQVPKPNYGQTGGT